MAATTLLSLLQTPALPPPPISYVLAAGGGGALPGSTTVAPFLDPDLPAYVHKYPSLLAVVPSVRPLVMDWRPPTDDGAFELEARLGQWQGQYFQSGTSKAFLERVLHRFQTCQHWTKVTDWEETHDYYYDSPSLLGIRTTARFVHNKTTGHKQIVTSHLRKQVHQRLDFRYVALSPSTETPYDLRVTLNYEEHVSDQDLPSIVNPTSVRIKSRKSFYYQSENVPYAEPLWRFDVTRSWTAPTRTEAELKQRRGETTYELELECLDPRRLMVSEQHDAFYVACSLALKMKDFMTWGEFRWEPVAPVPRKEIVS